MSEKITADERFGTMTDDQRKVYLDELAKRDKLISCALQDVSQARPRPNRYILVLDFDGVLHSYTSGWKGADVIPDPPTNGAQDFCAAALREFEVWIVSSRCSQPGGSEAINRWLAEHDFPQGLLVSKDGHKPAAFITLDDRAITFNGLWPNPKELKNFQPWYKRNIRDDDNTKPIDAQT